MFYDPKKPVEKHRFRLPHWHQDDTYVFITWRLADSLPTSVVEHLSKTRETWLNTHPKPCTTETQTEFNRRFTLPLEDLLDNCHGSCCLRDPSIAKILAKALLHFHRDRYQLDSFVIMPNHLHLILKLHPEHPLERVIQSLKTYTARQINIALNQTGTLWQAGYWDRLIRSQNHLDWTPHHIFIFYDDFGDPRACIEVCFQCTAIKYARNLKDPTFPKQLDTTEEDLGPFGGGGPQYEDWSPFRTSGDFLAIANICLQSGMGLGEFKTIEEFQEKHQPSK